MITQTLVKELFEYRDGELYWKVRISNKIRIGDHVGNSRPDGRRETRVFGVRYLTYQLIYIMFHGFLPEEIDHADQDPTNSRIENLREASRAQNFANLDLRKTNTSGFMGVSRIKATGRFRVMLTHNGVRIRPGNFKTAEEAARVYDRTKLIHKGHEFSSLNFPLDDYIREGYNPSVGIFESVNQTGNTKEQTDVNETSSTQNSKMPHQLPETY